MNESRKRLPLSALVLGMAVGAGLLSIIIGPLLSFGYPGLGKPGNDLIQATMAYILTPILVSAAAIVRVLEQIRDK